MEPEVHFRLWVLAMGFFVGVGVGIMVASMILTKERK